MKQQKTLRFLTTFIILSILISCQTRKAIINHGLPITNQWIISSFEDENNTPVFKSSLITINEKEKKFNGNGACNAISGNVFISGNSIKFEKIISTRMSCPHLKQEAKFIQTLNDVTNFEIKGCELFLFQGNKKIATLESCR